MRLSLAVVRYYLGRLMPLEVAARCLRLNPLTVRLRDIGNLDATLASVSKALLYFNAPGTLAEVKIICKLVQVYREMQPGTKFRFVAGAIAFCT